MGLAYDIVVAGVIALISFVIHYIGVELFAPGTPLFRVATDGTAVINGGALSWQWAQIIIVWAPLGGILVAVAWPFLRSYRRQANTAVRQVR